MRLDFSKKWMEPALLALGAILYFLLRFGGLRAEPLNLLYDEGIWLSLMKLVAEGKGEIYRDFVMVHPPGVMWAGAWIWNSVQGDIFTLRVIFIALCSLACVPTYLLFRRLYGVRTALAALFLLTVTPGFCAWLGRSLMLDLALHVPLYCALWLLVCPPSRRVIYPILAGLLLGFGEILKETAITAGLAISLALLLNGYLTRRRAANAVKGDPKCAEPSESMAIPADGMDGRAGLGFTVAFLMSFGLLTLLLCRIPNYGYYAFILKAQSARRPWGIPGELLNGFYMLPLQMTFGVAGAAMMLRSPDARERFLALFAFINTVLMIALPNAFYWRYLMPGMPIFTLGIVLWWRRFRDRSRSITALSRSQSISASALSRRLQIAGLTLFTLVGVVTGVLYYAKDMHSPPAYKTALAVLARSPGPVFTLDPIWIVASKQAIYPWPLTADAEFDLPAAPRPQAFTSAAEACPTVLLNHVTLQLLPKETEDFIRQRYRTIFRYGESDDRRYVEILVRRE